MNTMYSNLRRPDRQGAAAAAAPASSHRLRVLLVVESAGGGTGRHVLDLAAGLAARGCDVHLIYSPLRIDGVFADRLTRLVRDGSISCSTIPARSSIHSSDLAAALKVRRYIREHGPFDVVHGHSSKGGALARLAALGTGCPVLYTPHGLVVADPSVPLPKRAVYLAIEWGLARVTSRIITVSPEERRSASRSGLGRWRLVVVPNGVDGGPVTARSDARRAIGLNEDETVVGFVGRLVEAKAPQMLIEAFARAAAGVPRARLAIIGDGPLMPKLRELATAHGVGDRTTFFGERDAQGAYAAFDVFAISSRKEGLPYVVLEAMAAGLPVAATASSGVELLVEPGVNGEVVARDDMPAFAAALRRLITDASLRSRYAEAARLRAARFTVDGMVEATLATYRAAIGTKPARPDSGDTVSAEEMAAAEAALEVA